MEELVATCLEKGTELVQVIADAIFNLPASEDVDGPMVKLPSPMSKLPREKHVLAPMSQALPKEGRRPSYRSVQLPVRQKLNIACSSKLSTEDLEAEIFLYLLLNCFREESSTSSLWESPKASNDVCMELGFDEQKVQANAASKIGAGEIQSLIFKGGSMLTLSKIYQLVAHKLIGKVFLEAVNYQIKKEVIKKCGQLAAINLESQAALLTAKQGLAGAASRYLGFRSMMSLLGPILWGTFLADVVIQMLGTDYARVVRAIFALPQIRITCSYK